MDVNMRQQQILVEKMRAYFNGDLKDKHIAQWGLSFKPNTDDIRESPAIATARQLVKAGAIVSAYDPEAMNGAHLALGDQVTFAGDMYAALENADALVVVTEWNVFRSPDFEIMKRLMRGHAIFDGRNIYSNEEMHEQGFHYESIGRP
jgi:UDPglucose 6-dehydrogenase